MAHRVDSLVILKSVADKIDEQKRLFITTLERVATVSVACKAVGITMASAYRWRKEDEDFASDWDNALTYAFDALESATYLKVAKVLQDDKKRISPPEAKLIEMFLAGAKPDKYRQRSVEINNSNAVELGITIDWSSVPDEVMTQFNMGQLTLQDVYDRTIATQQKTASTSEAVSSDQAD